MKKWLVLALAVLLCGCAKAEYETMADEYTPLPPEQKARMVLSFAGDQEVASMEAGDQESICFCDGYTLTRQVLEAGDLDKTLRAVTGYARDQLSIMAQTQDGCKRYDFVWSCAGEGGDQVCRGSILDDGSYHYVVTAMASQEKAGELRATWNGIFSSFSLNTDPGPGRTEP